MRTQIGFIILALILGSWFNLANAGEKHLFYLHGCCIKDENDPKVKIYAGIVEGLKSSGFNVKYELRTAKTGDSNIGVQLHAKKLAEQIRELLTNGTRPEDITVAGYSLGSMTALVTAGLVNNAKVNFVLLAGCPIKPAIPITIDYAKLKGRILSIRDTKDVKFGSCDGKFPASVNYREIVLETGLGHALFRTPDVQHTKLWRDPLIAWSGM